MAGLSDDVDWESLRSDAENEQTNAGLAHIAQSVAEFRDQLMDRGFRRKEAYRMARDFLYELLGKIGESED